MYHKFEFSFPPLAAPKQEGNSKLPIGHPMPPSGQSVASKCPFLAAEMNQKNSGVVRQVAMEFQEDVQEIRTVQKGEKSVWYWSSFSFLFCMNLNYFVFVLSNFFRSLTFPVEAVILGQYQRGRAK